MKIAQYNTTMPYTKDSRYFVQAFTSTSSSKHEVF
jgi:hypothetical protein